MKKISILLIFFVSFCSLNAQEVVISGTVDNTSSSEVTLKNAITDNVLKTGEMKNGKFSITADIDGYGYYSLNFDAGRFVLLVLKPGDKVNIYYDLNNVESIKIEGSEDSKELYSSLLGLKKFDDKLAEYQNKIIQEKKQYLKEKIKKKPKSLTWLLMLDQFDIEEDFEIFKILSEALSEYSDNPLVADLQSKVKSQGNLAIGSLAPEIELENPDGQIVKLSSLRGKYVLVDFWAGWCGPCRRESPNLVAAYKKYKNKGFTIYSVSLDAERESWLNAIEQDGLGDWTHVSDLKYWDSYVVDLYGFNGIPFNVLIDPDGKIIAKNLRGNQLEKTLSNIFDK